MQVEIFGGSILVIERWISVRRRRWDHQQGQRLRPSGREQFFFAIGEVVGRDTRNGVQQFGVLLVIAMSVCQTIASHYIVNAKRANLHCVQMPSCLNYDEIRKRELVHRKEY